MQLPKIDSISFDVAFPLQTLKPVSSLLRSRVQSDVIDSNLNWQDRLQNAVLEIPLKAYSNLAEPTVSMSKLLVLKRGDVLPVNVEDTVDFYVEDQKYFLAEMGQVKGNIAVNLKERLNILGEKNER